MNVDDVAAEIRALRKGRGLQFIGADRHLGEHLSRLAGGADAVVRRTLIGRLERCATHLPDDLCIVVLASLAITPETRNLPTFEERVGWLARRFGVVPRTVLRRIDKGERLLAEAVVAALRRPAEPPPALPTGWDLELLSTVLRLDKANPEAHEVRRVVATRDGVDEVMAWRDVLPRGGGPPTLEVEVSYGGQLVKEVQSGSTAVQYLVRLPASLGRGETHEYGLVVRVSGEAMRPHYLFTPECRCARFDLRVRFDPARPPRWVRRVDGETVRSFDAARCDGDCVPLDAAGEVAMSFEDPIRYLGYGAQWKPDGDA